MKNNTKCTQTLHPYIIHIIYLCIDDGGTQVLKKILFTLSKQYPQYKVSIIVHIAKFEKDLAFSNGNYIPYYKKLQECLDENRYSILLSWPFVIMQIKNFYI